MTISRYVPLITTFIAPCPERRYGSQTAHNLYLCFDLCTGGELFDRICAKGNYYEECVLYLFAHNL